MSALYRHLNTYKYIYISLLVLVAIVSFLGYVSCVYKYYAIDYEWNMFYIHYGLTLGFLSIVLNILILTRVNEKSTTSNSLSLELLENLIKTTDGDLTIISPTFLLGDPFKNKIEFDMYTKALKNVANAGRKLKIFCLGFDQTKINNMSKLSYEDLLQESDFNNSELMMYHYKLSKEYFSDNPTIQRDYLKIILKNLEYFTPGSQTASNVTFEYKTLLKFGQDKILLVLTNSKAAMGGWSDDGVVSLNLIENKGAIKVLEDLKKQYT